MDLEQDIIVRLNKGDKEAMKHIFNLYHKSLYHFAKQIINSSEQTEEIVADAFSKLWQKNTDFNELPAIKLFLYVIVGSSCMDYLAHLHEEEQSHQSILELVEKDEDYIESKMIKAELLEILSQEIERLPLIRQKIFKMSFLDGLNVFEIAERLQMTIDSVRVQKAKAMHSIRSLMLKENI